MRSSSENHEWNFSVWRHTDCAPFCLRTFFIRCLLVLISLLLRFKLMEYGKCLRLQRFSFPLSFFVPIRIYLYHERKHLIRFILLRFAFMMRSSCATPKPTQNFIHLHRARYDFTSVCHTASYKMLGYIGKKWKYDFTKQNKNSEKREARKRKGIRVGEKLYNKHLS